MANYEILVNTFERINFFLLRLKSYTSVRLTPDMMELLAKIMAQVLFVLALSTKVMKQNRISMSILFMHPVLADYDTEKTVKRLAGRTDVEDALQRLNVLTNEEGLMAAASTLEAVVHVEEIVTQVEGVVHRVHNNVEANLRVTQRVEHNVVEIKKDVHEVGNNMASMSQDMRLIDKAVNKNTLSA